MVNSKGTVGISYRHFGQGELRFITNSSGSFNEITLESGGGSGRWSSTALAPSGRVHVTHEKENANQLRHVFFSGCP